jgi:hypothetical protein
MKNSLLFVLTFWPIQRPNMEHVSAGWHFVQQQIHESSPVVAESLAKYSLIAYEATLLWANWLYTHGISAAHSAYAHLCNDVWTPYVLPYLLSAYGQVFTAYEQSPIPALWSQVHHDYVAPALVVLSAWTLAATEAATHVLAHAFTLVMPIYDDVVVPTLIKVGNHPWIQWLHNSPSLALVKTLVLVFCTFVVLRRLIKSAHKVRKFNLGRFMFSLLRLIPGTALN